MSEEDRPIRVGLIGYGYAGRTFHAPLVRSVPGLKLDAVASSQGDDVHSQLGNVKVCDAAALIRNPAIDLIIIACPNVEHFRLAYAALKAGKHVVVEKPFTVTLSEARMLRDLAAAESRLLTVFQNRRWDSEVLALEDVIKQGTLGRIVHFECRMDRYRPGVRHRWREDPGAGAGLWFDLGPHLIDLTVHLFGLPQSVNANLAILRDGGRTDDWAHVQLNYEGLRVILQASLLSSGNHARSVAHGTKASWTKYGADIQEIQLQSGMSPTDPEFGIDPTPSILYSGVTGEKVQIASPTGNQRLFYVALRDSILYGKPLPVSLRDAIAVMAILETSFQSSVEGKTLQIPLSEEERPEWTG
jgi:predicted dehydrogenase